MNDYGFGTFDTELHCEDLAGEAEYMLLNNPMLYADPLDLIEDLMGEEQTLP